MDYNGHTFRNEDVRLDGNSFTECVFENVVFYYAGGVFHLHNNRINGFRVQIDGDLARGLDGLRMFHHQGGPKAVKSLVDGVSAFLRKSVPVETFTIG